MRKASVFLDLHSACSLQFASWHGSLTISCWPLVLPGGCDLNLLNGVKKLLDSAKSLVTNFSAKICWKQWNFVKKSVIFDMIKEIYKVIQCTNFSSCTLSRNMSWKCRSWSTHFRSTDFLSNVTAAYLVCFMTHSSWRSLSNGCMLLYSSTMLSDKQSEHSFSPTTF